LSHIASSRFTPLNFLPSLLKAKKAGTSFVLWFIAIRAFYMHQRNQKHRSHDSHDVWTNHINRGKPAVILCCFDLRLDQPKHLMRYTWKNLESHVALCANYELR
jgi:hypothetical protein